MKKKTTKKTSRVVAAEKLNSITPTPYEHVDQNYMVERWKVLVSDTQEIYFADTKVQALEYIGKKGATSFTLKEVRIPFEMLMY